MSRAKSEAQSRHARQGWVRIKEQQAAHARALAETFRDLDRALARLRELTAPRVRR